jgi:protein-tyrosine phosphatase
MVEFYSENGIIPCHFPIHDFNETDLKEKLFRGATILNKMINEEGLKVYVHCTAGMGRAPAIVLTYLCLFKGMDPDESNLFVKSYRTVSVPNMRAVKEVVAKHLNKVVV